MFNHELSLHWPKQLVNAEGRIYEQRVDLRFDNGEVVHFSPSSAKLRFEYVNWDEPLYKVYLSGLARPLVNEASPAILQASQDIQYYFDNKTDTILGANPRSIIRKLHEERFAPNCYVWRLASLYLTAAWVEASGEMLDSQAYLNEVVPIDSIAGFVHQIERCYDLKINPIVVTCNEEPASDVIKLLPILLLAAAEDPGLVTDVALPSVAKQWPDLGQTEIFFHGPLNRPSSESNPPGLLLTKSNVFEAAMLYCRHHNCHDLFMTYVDSIAALWTSRDRTQAPIFESDALLIQLPVFYTVPTILLPICQYIDYYYGEEQDTCRQLFCRGVNTSCALTLLIRASTQPKQYPSILNAQKLAWVAGFAGQLGPLQHIDPIFRDSYALEEWWQNQPRALRLGRQTFPQIMQTDCVYQ